ncbi:hypothetical protein DICSQDRAFT_171327 [Dichomitus squalens LYAD-421 SS1]|uniref:Uncharacterized protein n=1 Tax=Dichomitus squalens (strain LYAD-421) TaxID=732165 RepID=R7SWI8_DICSQ|nr:uncharacterized protein DICSQDRAFT_171327 [Dichomitus squalens LYAD-421 SS1]EJF60095.1 hypothetical protein DICSQDRAFT_171327 [Dichomitus squalens LYAD-421 SS1]
MRRTSPAHDRRKRSVLHSASVRFSIARGLSSCFVLRHWPTSRGGSPPHRTIPVRFQDAPPGSPQSRLPEPDASEPPAHDQPPADGEAQADDEPEHGHRSHDVTGPLPEPTPEPSKQAVALINALKDVITALKNASLEGSRLDPTANRELRLALQLFVINGHSERSSRLDTASIVEDYEGRFQLPTYEAMQRLVQELSGVVPIVTAMYPETSVAYTECGPPRYEWNLGRHGYAHTGHKPFWTLTDKLMALSYGQLTRMQRCGSRGVVIGFRIIVGS